MIIENLSTLKINKMTQAQYDRELAAGNISATELYLTPDSAASDGLDGISIWAVDANSIAQGDTSINIVDIPVPSDYKVKVGDLLLIGSELTRITSINSGVATFEYCNINLKGQDGNDGDDGYGIFQVTGTPTPGKDDDYEISINGIATNGKQIKIGDYLLNNTELLIINSISSTKVSAKTVVSLRGTDGKSAYKYAQEAGYTGTESEFAEKLAGTMDYTETDPTVPAWAKASKKPTYTASEVGADASGTASSTVSAHNANEAAHPDIRTKIDTLQAQIDELKGAAPYTNRLSGALNLYDMTKVLTGDDGSIGYLNNMRNSSSGSYVSTSGWDTSGLMPGKAGDIIRLKNVTMKQYSEVPSNGNHGNVAFILEDGTWYTSASLQYDNPGEGTLFESNINDEDGNIIQFTLPNWGDYSYFSICCQDLNARSVITVNEEIIDSEETILEELQYELNELDNRVTTLEAAAENSDGLIIPSYWQKHLNERVEDIRRAMESAGRNKSAFFFYSDAHWSNDDTYTAKFSPTLLRYLYTKTSINKTNYGGDIVSAESADTDVMAYLWNWREQLRNLPNHHSVIGNHDDGNGIDRLLSKDYVYAYLFAPEETNDIVWGGDFYYYIDNIPEKTRYLYLDIFYSGITTEQQNFVKEALKTTPSNWHIVVVSHALFDNDYSVYPPVLQGLASAMQPIYTMFDAYNARTGDFSNCTGKVELCVGGHYHLDHYDYTDGGIPCVIVEADTIHNRSGSWPQKGTINESAVSAIICDYNTEKVNIIRVGRGNSYTVDMNGGGSVTTYSITNNLTNCTNDNSATSIASGEGYYAMIYADDGYNLDTVTITMGGVDITSSVFIDGSINIDGVTGNIVITAIALSSDEPGSYTNVLDTVGYKKGVYLSNGNESPDENAYTTGYISCTPGDIIRLKNVTMPDESSHGNRISCYDSSKAFINGTTYNIISDKTGLSPVFENGNLVQFTVPSHSGTAYIRLSAWLIDSTSIITINQEIPEGDTPTEPSYTNVMLSSIASDGTPFADGKGWMANSRVGSGGIYAGNQTPGTDAAQWVTGHIPIDGFGTKKISIYLKNVDLQSTSTNSNHGIFFFDANFNKISPMPSGAPSHFTVESLRLYQAAGFINADGTFYRVDFSPGNSAENTAVKYFCICCGGLSDESIITIDEEIPEDDPQGYENLIDTIGYTNGKRLGTSDGSFRDNTATMVTNMIPFNTAGDVFRTSGLSFEAASESNCGVWIYYEDQSYWTYINTKKVNSPISMPGSWGTIAVDASGNLTITAGADAAGYIRLVGIGSGANLIVTKNQEIN